VAEEENAFLTPHGAEVLGEKLKRGTVSDHFVVMV
jgi:hypothetical protein